MTGSTGLLLRLDEISKSFAGVQALDHVQFDLSAGEVHALVGENGAGKSTLIKILSGIVQPDGGTIEILGKRTEILNPHHARTLGIGTIFQELSQIASLTVSENVYLGREQSKRFLFLDRRWMAEATGDTLIRFGIRLDPRAMISDLSTAQRQLAEIVKAISMQPRILIMDEPTSSLTEGETDILFKIVEEFRSNGAGIIYVSHRIDEVFKIADNVTVLRDGKRISHDPVKELTLDKIVKLMVGRDIQLYESGVKRSHETEDPQLEVRGLTRTGVFEDISFTVYKGEILGIAGLVGSGRSEVARAIFGVDPIDHGEILVKGQVARLKSVRDALAYGIAMVPESRHLQGLVLKHSVEQNMTLPILNHFSRFGVMNYRLSRQFVRQKIKQFDIRAGSERQVVNYLSGGNQQKVVVSKWLSTEPKVLIVDELTAGIDVRTKSEVHRLIRKLSEAGMSVLMISSDMPELLAHSDRIIVMNGGRILGTFDHASQEQIMSLIMDDTMRSRTDPK